MLTPLLLMLCTLQAAASQPSQAVIDHVVSDVIANIFHLTHDNHAQQIDLVSHYFSPKGLQSLRDLLKDSGTDMLVEDHHMTVTSERQGAVLVEPVAGKTDTYRMYIPLLLTFNNAQATITKPVVESFEVVMDNDQTQYRIHHMTEILTGEVAMVDKGYRRARSCPMFHGPAPETNNPS